MSEQNEHDEAQISDEGYDLDDQRGDEEVILVRHQHPWVLAKMGSYFVILALIVVGAYLIWHMSKPTWIILALALGLIIVYGLNRAYLYKNSVFVITDQRVINVYQGTIFNRLVQEVDLENIYNLTYEIKGPMASLMNFGTIKLTTIGDASSSIKVRDIENPYFVYNKISDLRQKVLGKSGQRD